MPAHHAMLGASNANRWLNCPPSALLTADLPDTAGQAAAEGTLAHAIGELKLRKHYAPMGPREYNAALKKLHAETLYIKEMDGATDEYLDLVKEIALGFPEPPYVALEQRVDFSQWVPEGFGTADCIIIGGDTLHVIDFKFGKGVPVPAEGNPQMQLYALGAYARYQFLHDIRQVRMTIFQPRNGGRSDADEISITDLTTWADEFVAPRAALAAEGKGEFEAGGWCRFCKVRATCRARSDHNLALEGFQAAKPPLITDAEVGEALRRALDLKSWASDLEEYALSALLLGKEIAGWKAVEGRAVRTWTDEKQALAAAKTAGLKPSQLYVRKPVTLAALEKLMGKKAFADALGTYVTIPPGKPALAQESDRRPAIANRPSAEDDFGTNEKEN